MPTTLEISPVAAAETGVDHLDEHTLGVVGIGRFVQNGHGHLALLETARLVPGHARLVVDQAFHRLGCQVSTSGVVAILAYQKTGPAG